ncbi:MAG: site-2 protease family protein [Acholeplasmataceae bacterium]
MKRYHWLMLFLITFMAGFFYTALEYLNLWNPISDGFKMLPWWSYILIFIVTFYVTLTVHEMTHFISFKLKGIKLRAIYLTVFVFYKTQTGWKFMINPKLWVLFGGLVVPDLDFIDSDEKYDKTVDAFAVSLLSAPLATIIFALTALIGFVITLLFATNPLFLTIFFIFTILTTLISLVYIKSFSLSTQNIFGDFVAYKKVKIDPIFQLAQFIQYQKFSLNNDRFNPYLFDKVVNQLGKKQKVSNQLLFLNLLINYFEGVNYYNQAVDQDVDLLIKTMSARNLRKDEMGLMVAYELAIYKYHTGDVDKSYEIYKQIQKIKYHQIDEKLMTYQLKRFEHITHLAYHDDFLNDKAHMYVDHLWLFDRIINPFSEIEVMHKKQKMQLYACKVVLREDELDREMI